jgi:hypothetical protein
VLIQKKTKCFRAKYLFFATKKKWDILCEQDILWAREEHSKLTFAPFWSQYILKSSLEAHLKVAVKFGIWELSRKMYLPLAKVFRRKKNQQRKNFFLKAYFMT